MVTQRRLGREIILGTSLAVPLGCVVLLLIGLGARGPDRLMKWWSGGIVDEFHEKERGFARKICVAYAVVLVMVAVVAATSVDGIGRVSASKGPQLSLQSPVFLLASRFFFFLFFFPFPFPLFPFPFSLFPEGLLFLHFHTP
jgi:hypothetical protein